MMDAKDIAVTTKKIKFPNGDEYEGGWRGGLPEGKGTYKWGDGSQYEGGWKEGQKSGVGQYTWPSGATYIGEWQNGCMHGVGTFDGPDGTKYQGGWAEDLKHGLGKKVYANGDTYEGLWRHGKAEGPGRYMWFDGNEYDGEWKGGRMQGFGTFKWKTRERYDGEWKDGREDGMGVFTWKDGSTYDGFWKIGKKHGVGIFRRTPQVPSEAWGNRQNSPLSVTTPQMSSVAGSEVSGMTFSQASTATVDSSVWSDVPISAPKKGSLPSGNPLGVEYVELREYNTGKMLRQQRILAAIVEQVIGPLQMNRDDKRGLFKQSEKKAGENIFKGHRSYDLMLNLQLGIRWSLSKTAQEGIWRQLADVHFAQKLKQRFPHEGTTATPPHPSNDFKWKDYCPAVFRKLREVFGVSDSEYMLSLCGDKALRELSSPGKSGAIFFISHDDTYFIKTMRKHEVKLLLDFLPRYYYHTSLNPHTLLTKFYGLYRITPKGGKKVRFVVMGNILSADLHIHRRYDLKGSTQGRTAGQKVDKERAILKDLDIDVSFKLDEDWYQRLTRQLRADCQLLEQLRVMDYSLYMGVHIRSREPLSPSAADEVPGGRELSDIEEDQVGHSLAMIERTVIERKLGAYRLTAQQQQDLLAIAQAKLQHKIAYKRKSGRREVKRTATLRPAHDDAQTDELAHQLGHFRVELGQGMSAVAIPMVNGSDQSSGAADSSTQAEDVVLYFGIIDFLQEYTISKKVEHGIKSLAHHGSSISAVDPVTYSKRFQQFLQHVFI